MSNKYAANPHRSFSPRQLIRGPVRARRYGLPGELWHYSNTGYWLLGVIVKRVTDRPLASLFKRRIFNRVGMGETSFRPRRPVPEPAAHGYVGRLPIPIRGGAGDPSGAPVDVTDVNWSWAWTAGAVTSTLEDLRRWASALATGRGVLSKRTQAERLRGVPTGFGWNYGLGVGEFPGARFGTFYGHNGEGPGYDTEVFYAPEAKLTIVALGNTAVGDDPLRPSQFDCLGLDGIVPLLLGAVAGQAVAIQPCPS